MAAYTLVLSCEHGGNKIPLKYKQLFKHQKKVLSSHRGWDPGTLDIANVLSKALDIPLVSCTISRLLIEMNRSPDHPKLFSEFSNALNDQEKAFLVSTYYLPYRNSIKKIIEEKLTGHKVCIHFSMHSFTPILNGTIREVDIGILFDPERPLELDISYKLQKLLLNLLPDMVVQMNAPYKGTDDGLTTYLRTQFDNDQYAGIEIEINQKWVDTPNMSLIQNALQTGLSSFKKRKPAVH